MFLKCGLVLLLFSVESFFHQPNFGEAVDNIPKKNNRAKHLNIGLRKNHKYGDDYDPMTSYYAPPKPNRGATTNRGYTAARLREIRKNLMYPYYDKGREVGNTGDYLEAITSSTSKIQKNFNFQLPFFGFRYNYTRVSLNGYVEFSDPPQNPLNVIYPLVFPVKEFPKQNDPSFIGIFFSKCRIGKLRVGEANQRKPGVYFRVEDNLRRRTDQMGVEIRERVKWDVREGAIGANNFDPKHVIIVTWKNVSFAGGIDNSLYKTNTFQLVLATDEVFTYAMFNYLNLAWTSHTEAGGDVTNGEGGTPAFVGFNAGNGRGSWEYPPYSQNSIIPALTTTGNGNSLKGRHIFRIDENIELNNCNGDISGANLDLFLAPQSGNMLGGTIVNITGPCFNPTDTILCKFDTEAAVYGTVVDSNRAICVQPPMTVEGYVKIQIAIGPQIYKWKGNYYVETPATATQNIFFDTMSYTKKNPDKIVIRWNRQNLTLDNDAAIDISLWGFRKTENSFKFVYIDNIASRVENSGLYTIIPEAQKNRIDNVLNDIQFGFIKINVTDPITVFNRNRATEISPVLWSRPIPLAWYFSKQWKQKYGPKWAKTFCDNWLRNDRVLDNFTSNLPQCPCTLAQALADKGRYMPDLECDKDSNPKCFFNRGAVHCVKSGTPSKQGAEQQCCYDKNLYLMLSHDQKWGSYPYRSHNLAYSPWKPTHIPTISQWYNDISPRFACCLWQEEAAHGCEAFRYKMRPTEDCVAYKGPGIAGVFGDPHIITFDDLEYMFNGKGEFVLVRSENISNRLEVQGRFEQMAMNAYGEIRATQLTSVAARGNTSTIIEVRQRPKEARWRYHLDVFADGKRIYFDRPSLKFQHFLGVTVYTPTYISNQSEVIVMFDSGAGVEVIENNGYMTARVYLPQTFINQTRGLFGNWSSDRLDDFALPNGTISNSSAKTHNTKRIHNEFGMTWMVDDAANLQKGGSLFHRDFGRTAAYYNEKTFIPEFRLDVNEIIQPNRSEYRYRSSIICNPADYQCLYDYALTYNRDLALSTTKNKNQIIKLKTIAREKVVSCGVLKTPRFGRKSSFLFMPSARVTFECRQNYTLVGNSRRVCLETGEWNIPEHGDTKCVLKGKNATLGQLNTIQ